MPQTQTETPAGQPAIAARLEAAKLARLFLKAVHALPASNERSLLQKFMYASNIPMVLGDVVLNAELNTLKNIKNIGPRDANNLSSQLGKFGIPQGSLINVFSGADYGNLIRRHSGIYIFTEQGLDRLHEITRAL